MILVIDVGNTNTVLAVMRDHKLVYSWRISTIQRTTDEFGMMVLDLLRTKDWGPPDLAGCVISCVVPSTLYAMEKASRRYLDCAPIVIGRGVKTGIRVRTDNPREVGTDRVVNAIAAIAKWSAPLVIVDFGTATTFDCVDHNGDYVGGAIAPGLQISAEALFTRTAQLPKVEVRRPRKAIGTNTIHSMQSGLFHGYVGLVDNLVRECKEELSGKAGGTRVTCIATGGLSNLVGRACREIDDIDAQLTVRGLSMLFERNA